MPPMLEGLHPTQPTHMMRLETSERAARIVADAISETFDPAETAVAAFEAADGQLWLVEVFFRTAPDETNVRELIRATAGPAVAAAVSFGAIDARDWVRTSLDGLKPVPAGRFLVHGSHDRARVPAQAIGIEIEAALAFGTGHHGTTLGCLKAIDRLAKVRRPRRVLDVGTGTGVLAIAAALRHRVPVLGSDIDAASVIAARENARLNHAAPWCRMVLANGLKAAAFGPAGRHDLVLANILPRPLMALSRDIARHVAPGGDLVLSGILKPFAPLVLTAYRTQGLRFTGRELIDGWVTLTFKRGR